MAYKHSKPRFMNITVDKLLVLYVYPHLSVKARHIGLYAVCVHPEIMCVQLGFICFNGNVGQSLYIYI